MVYHMYIHSICLVYFKIPGIITSYSKYMPGICLDYVYIPGIYHIFTLHMKVLYLEVGHGAAAVGKSR